MAPQRLFAILFLAAALVVAGLAHTAPSFPALTGRVVDQAGLLDAGAEARLDSKLADLEAKTSTQLVVITLRSLQGYDIADYATVPPVDAF
jgi:uncharacterized protein